MCDSHKEKTDTPDLQMTEFGVSSFKSKKRKVIYFSSGETLEEDTEEDEEEEEDAASARQSFREPTEKARFLWKNAVLVGRMSLRSCDVLGEKLAGLLGLNAAKYQYAIDEYHRENKDDDGSKPIHKAHCGAGAETFQLSPTHGTTEYGATTSTGALPGFVESNDLTSDNGYEGAHNKGYEADSDE